MGKDYCATLNISDFKDEIFKARQHKLSNDEVLTLTNKWAFITFILVDGLKKCLKYVVCEPNIQQMLSNKHKTAVQEKRKKISPPVSESAHQTHNQPTFTHL